MKHNRSGSFGSTLTVMVVCSILPDLSRWARNSMSLHHFFSELIPNACSFRIAASLVSIWNFFEGRPHPSVASLVRRVSHFFPSVLLPGFQKNLGPKCKMLLHPFLTFIHSCAQVSWVLAFNVLPEGAERKLKVSQFFFVPFQEATRCFRVTMSLSAQRCCLSVSSKGLYP